MEYFEVEFHSLAVTHQNFVIVFALMFTNKTKPNQTVSIFKDFKQLFNNSVCRL